MTDVLTDRALDKLIQSIPLTLPGLKICDQCDEPLDENWLAKTEAGSPGTCCQSCWESIVMSFWGTETV
jgi:hypothetical protein